jgi:hypothetical protein
MSLKLPGIDETLEQVPLVCQASLTLGEKSPVSLGWSVEFSIVFYADKVTIGILLSKLGRVQKCSEAYLL